MAELSDKMIMGIESHLLKGLPIETIRMRESERERLRICMDVYYLYDKNRIIPAEQLLEGAYRRRGMQRTLHEKATDRRCLDYMLGLMMKPMRNAEKQQVNAVANMLIAQGAATGNVTALKEGAAIKREIHQLDIPDDQVDVAQNVAPIPIMITRNPQDAGIDRQMLSEEDKRKIFDRMGISSRELEKFREESDDLIQEVEPDTDNEPADFFVEQQPIIKKL